MCNAEHKSEPALASVGKRRQQSGVVPPLFPNDTVGYHAWFPQAATLVPLMHPATDTSLHRHRQCSATQPGPAAHTPIHPSTPAALVVRFLPALTIAPRHPAGTHCRKKAQPVVLHSTRLRVVAEERHPSLCLPATPSRGPTLQQQLHDSGGSRRLCPAAT